MKKIIFENNNQIKKSNSFSVMKNPNNNSFNLTFTQFPKKKNLLINQNNYYNNNNKKFNSTLTEWRNNSFNINNNIQIINTHNTNNTHSNSHDKLKNYVYNSSAPSLLNIHNNNKQKKKSLILDLDETLVHSSFFPFERASDLTLPIKVDNHNRLVYILRRPYAIEFMKEMSQYYEIIIYTASIPEYASNLLDELDKYNIISKRYYRYNCILNKGMYIKDLRIIGKPFKDLIIIDNNPISYVYNINNGLPILSWYGDPEDIELLKLIPLLKFLSKVDDVTYIIPQIVNREKNKIKYSLINKLINNEDSNLNLNQPNNFGAGNIKKNDKEKNENNIKNNNDNEVVLNDRNNNNSHYSNYVNNIPNKLINNNNNNNNINLKYFNNNINLVSNTKYINNNEVNTSFKKNQKFENNINKNFNESNELRDSVFSPEEPINLNNIKDFEKEEQKNNNDNYEYLNRTPIIEKKNSKSYTPDFGIHRMIYSKYQENDCILNKFHKIEENNFKKKSNYIGQKYNDKNYCNNHNCWNKNKCIHSQYKNEINKTTPNTVLNNSMKNNIMKYFIPNYNNNNISNNKNKNNNNIINNNTNNINNNNNNNNYSGKIKENNNNSNYLNNKTYGNNYNNIENKYYNFNNIYTYHNKNGKDNAKYNINNNESNIYDNNNINPKNNIINNNHNNFNRQNNNNNITCNNNINQSYNNIYNFYRPKYNLNYINKEDSRDNHIIINNNKNNSNSHNNNIKPYNNKNVNTNNNYYIKEYLNEHNNIIKSKDNFYSEKLKAVNDKINEIRNTLNKTEYIMKERKKKLCIENKINKDNSFSNKNEDYFRKYNNINPISNCSEKSNNFNIYKNIKSINNNNILFNNENNISNNNKYDFNIQKENINNIQNQRCPTLNELINYKNYSVEKEESNKQTETYSNNSNLYNGYQDKNSLYNEINYNLNNNIYSNYINCKIKPNKNLLYNDDFNNNFFNYNNKIMNRSFSSFYPKNSINNYINGKDIINSMNNITNSNQNILY